MKSQMFKIGILAAMLSASIFTLGCNSEKGTSSDKSRVIETVDLTPGKSISPENKAKLSSIGLKVLDHVSKAQQDIQAKKVDAAKKELTETVTLLNTLKEVLPTIDVIDRIWVTRTDLSYISATEIQQDLVPIDASIDQLYEVLPTGKAKEHTKQAKEVLKKEKHKGASKAKEELEMVEEALDFREVDLSVSYTSRLVKDAQTDLEKGKTKEASDALNAVADGVVFFDATVIDPADLAVQRIWLATQDYSGKNYKAAKTRLEKAKTALLEIVKKGEKTLQADAKNLISKIESIDITKAEDKTAAALEALWQDARKLVGQTQLKGTAAPDSKGKADKEAQTATETFIRAADQIDLAEVKLGKIAEDHAASEAVKKFGVRMVRDHSLMNKELREITSKKGISLVDVLDPKHQQLIDDLSKLKGAEFDRTYTKDMVTGHEKAIEQFESEGKNGHDPEVKAWAEKWVPTLREHLALAQEAVKDIKGK